jgi:hypothetical protein
MTWTQLDLHPTLFLFHHFSILNHSSFDTPSDSYACHIKKILFILLHYIVIILVFVCFLKIFKRLVPKVSNAIVRQRILSQA